MFDRGTIDKSIPSPKVKFGIAMFASAIEVLISPNIKLPAARITSPMTTTGLTPSFITITPDNMEAIKQPAPRGTIDTPLIKAEYPISDWSIDGKIDDDAIITPIKTT